MEEIALTLQAESQVRDMLHTKFGGSPVQTQILPFTEQVARTLVQERLLAALASCFGVLTLVLAAVGLYGLLPYTVANSTREIGIRVALGAQRETVLWSVLRKAIVLIGLGSVIGIPVALSLSRVTASMLFGLKQSDPSTIAGATAILFVSGLVAVLLPARRATRVDPMVALRYE